MGANDRRERARRSSVRWGVGVIGGLALTLVFALTAQNGLPDYLPGVSRNEIRATFADVGGLRAGDDVRIANVRTGFVKSIERIDGRTVIDMRLDHGREVYDDATVAVVARSALGQKFVDLHPGTNASGTLPRGGMIPLSRSASPVELDQVLDTLDPATLAATRSTLREVGGGFAGHGADLQDSLATLRDNLDGLSAISRALAADHGADTARLLEVADQFASTLHAQRGALARMTGNLADTLEALDVDRGQPLGAALSEAPQTLTRVRAALTSLDAPLAETGSAASTLRPGALALGRATPDLRALLRDSVTPLRKVPPLADAAGTAVKDLSGTLGQGLPLVTQIATALQRAVRPLEVLAPYAPEIMLFFRNAADALKHGDASGHWLRFFVVVNSQTVTSALPVRDPLLHRDPYPAPGAAGKHFTNQVRGR